MAPAAFYHTTNTVCVMYASGNLGSSLVNRLLQRGYTVHAAVQNHGDLELSGLPADNKDLKIFYADPFDYKSIVDALSGCSGLFYAFEPPKDHPTYDEYMEEIEVRAAHNVLEACAQTDSIDKVVFTSSATAILWRDNRQSILENFDERHWTDVNFCRKFKLWHALSKTLAEKAAWALAMDREICMVSVNAGLLMGPDLSIKSPYLKGAAEMYEDGVFVAVDLDFLVDAHICIFEDISAYGRYLCFNHIINRPEDAVQHASILALSASSSALPQSFDQDMRVKQQRISNKKLNKLMVDFRSRVAPMDE
uniref:NAD(P)-binding domain-containing protein n=1 Tax=Rhizophora mucronata TaxID=61149 RepID=A0A2P2KCR3_RHIMU